MFGLKFFVWFTLTAPLVAASVEFNRDIRPILSDQCFTCHGPDAGKRLSKLRLDSEQAAKADLGGHRAIVPGNPEQSELIRRVTHANRGLRMPPQQSGRTLSDGEIELLRRWIAEGAQWQSHWAFRAPARPALPVVRAAAWPRNAIDRFVLERLEKEDLQPSPEANRETLLRRVTLDLTGLPPTPAETEAFVNDPSPDAYEKVVDRLLASPRYGERMAAPWLAASRYADTNGYQSDGERFMWRWRDWVIDAFNRNMPYDQFALEQIAGDMLPGATLEQKIATGFNRNHRGNGEGGIIPEEYAVEYVVDRVETMSAVFLGLTMGCARCHDHKYDPISQKEFYRMYAYFNNIPERGRANKYGNSPPFIAAPTSEQQTRLEALEQKVAAARTEFKGFARCGGGAGGMGAVDRRRARSPCAGGEAPVLWCTCRWKAKLTAVSVRQPPSTASTSSMPATSRILDFTIPSPFRRGSTRHPVTARWLREPGAGTEHGLRSVSLRRQAPVQSRAPMAR